MSRFEGMVYEAVLRIDHTALHGREIRRSRLLDERIFNARPEAHAGALAGALSRLYEDLSARARAARRLSRNASLVARWTLVYDIYSPKLRRFVEVDEKQHFSAPRLERIRRHGALYPASFMTRLKALSPSRDLSPPHRDEQRAYRDAARELIPAAYGLAATVRLDEFSLRDLKDPSILLEELL